MCVSALFALGSSVMVQAAGIEGLYLEGGVNYMVLFEVLMVLVTVAVCYLLHWFAQQRRVAAGKLFVALLLCLPTFAVGVAMGVAYQPESMATLMWEISFWVILIAVFAYDMRLSPYLTEGLGVGLLFESMCMGQIMMQLVNHAGRSPLVIATSLLLGVAYLACVLWQLLRKPGERTVPAAHGVSTENETANPSAKTPATQAAFGESLGESLGDGAGSDAGQGELAEDPVSARCRVLGSEMGLTQSESRILVHIAHGRSARYIADELGVSFNTVRTHIRHVYEKLDIHSRQELIDLVS